MNDLEKLVIWFIPEMILLAFAAPMIADMVADSRAKRRAKQVAVEGDTETGKENEQI